MFGNLTWPFTTSRCEGLSGKKKAMPLVRSAMPTIRWKWPKVHWAWTNQSTWGSQKKNKQTKKKQKRSIRVTLMTITPRNGWQNKRIVCTKWKLMAVNSVTYRDFWLLTFKMVPWKWPAFIQKFDYYLNQRILWISRGYKTNCFLKINKFILNIGNHWVKSNYISTSRGYFGKSIQALRHHFGKSMSVKLPLTYRFVYIWPRVKFAYSESSFQYSTPSGLSF